MHIVRREDEESIKVLVNEFIVTKMVQSAECIPIEFLKYLRTVDMKIEDGALLNELCDLIQQKLDIK